MTDFCGYEYEGLFNRAGRGGTRLVKNPSGPLSRASGSQLAPPRAYDHASRRGAGAESRCVLLLLTNMLIHRYTINHVQFSNT